MATIAERQAEVSAIHSELFGERQHRRSAQRGLATPTLPTNIDDTTLLDKARHANDGAKFAALYDRGDWSGQLYPSQSEADLWLAGKLAFWTGRDSPRIDSLFRQSALMREKWNREDYRQRTLTAAIEGCVRTYRTNVTSYPNNSSAANGCREAASRQDDQRN